MGLDQNDIESIERLIYKNSDAIAVSIARSLERLEERIDAAKSHLNTRISEVGDWIVESRDHLGDSLDQICDDIRELVADKQ